MELSAPRSWVQVAMLSFALSVCASLFLAAMHAEKAYAYTYLNTCTASIYNRGWVCATESGNLELIGSDPIGPRMWMPSWQNPGGEYSYISNYQFAIWGDRNGQDDLVWYSAWNGAWSRGGANMGTGDLTGAKNGTGFGCIATYGYGWAGNVIAKHGGLDALMHNHIYISARGNDGSFVQYNYGAIDFWPRIKIRYDANGGSNAPLPHNKYIGGADFVASTKPTRTGYTFEGWSTKKSGPVNIASGQKIGYEDWNLLQCSSVPHGWNSRGPADFWRDPGAGQPSPSGTNVITLYAQWKPVTYSISYNGNGSTGGSTASSSHIYDAAKALTPNGFTRAYTLSCDARGGSAGNVSVPCTWRWEAWNAKQNGSGISFGNKASVKNLRSTKGTMTLYAQWSRGLATLPDPGQKPGCTFKGWFSAVSGGTLIGAVGDTVSIDKNTTCYARWEQHAEVSYYVDGESVPVHVDEVPVGAACAASSAAAAKATRSDCAGFDGWYVDEAYTQKYIEGSAVPASGMALYGRNEVTLDYAPTDATQALFDRYACYADDALSILLSDGAPLPASQTLHYGDRVSVERGASIWFEDRGRVREAVCDSGAYTTSEAVGAPARTIKLTCNTVAYLRWRVPAYDGIALS